jgi:hypothetical protein
MTNSEYRSAASALRSKASQLVLALLGAAGLWAAAAAAQAGDPPPVNKDQAQTAASGQTAKPDPQDRVICREEEVTGSILGGKRVCHTQREWDEMAKDAKDWMDAAGRVQNQNMPR